MDTFLLTLQQVGVLLFFMSFGYFFKRKSNTSNEMSGVLSKLLVWLFMPALNINSFAANFRLDNLRTQLPLVLAAVVILSVTLVLAIGLARVFGNDRMQRGIFTYAFAFPNYGYIGYPLVQAVFGDMALFNLMMFAIPYSIAIYTVGTLMLVPNQKIQLKSLLSPTLLSMVVGMLCGILKLQFPSILTNILTMASGCMAPTAMILIGFVLAKLPLRQAFTSPKAIGASIIRSLVIPCGIGFIMHFIGISHAVTVVAVSMLAMPIGMNTVVFPEAYGGDSTVGAQCCLVSNIFALITVPLVFMLLGIL